MKFWNFLKEILRIGLVFEVGEKENLEEIFTPEFHACLQIHQKRIWPEPFLPQELHPQCR